MRVSSERGASNTRLLLPPPEKSLRQPRPPCAASIVRLCRRQPSMPRDAQSSSLALTACSIHQPRSTSPLLSAMLPHSDTLRSLSFA